MRGVWAIFEVTGGGVVNPFDQGPQSVPFCHAQMIQEIKFFEQVFDVIVDNLVG
ncbi:MAG: hypothetical protein CM1200mP9_03930 [Gammaproteobacteria bacterium]|nr:MAG: hypothetical protein CM1200mP9_03930 [Gammaproteobacteria bacterium]